MADILGDGYEDDLLEEEGGVSSLKASPEPKTAAGGGDRASGGSNVVDRLGKRERPADASVEADAGAAASPAKKKAKRSKKCGDGRKMAKQKSAGSRSDG